MSVVTTSSNGATAVTVDSPRVAPGTPGKARSLAGGSSAGLGSPAGSGGGVPGQGLKPRLGAGTAARGSAGTDSPKGGRPGPVPGAAGAAARRPASPLMRQGSTGRNSGEVTPSSGAQASPGTGTQRLQRPLSAGRTAGGGLKARMPG
eukprot:CAMPEP_0202916742 /NCGR_PEP_ID=MMETSP1392-20130828/69319_1 /ASSEMBLY_ACC=CAM_ASM_000868 /TAXON_ID=225041 /ORGANISM="Chlamydomonas chlamydogama, Strain SAG 11-48b" /LENGTH=147 /DNA_ID=CAMNT_0049609273 /DNA_START=25 /DNA_END=464 /DNA_ORIENTATION=-